MLIALQHSVLMRTEGGNYVHSVNKYLDFDIFSTTEAAEKYYIINNNMHFLVFGCL